MSETMYDLDNQRRCLRSYSEVLAQRQNEENHPTATSVEQSRVEANVLKLYKHNRDAELKRHLHIELLKKSLTTLNEAYECLDCSRPWLCYWILHSLQLLWESFDDDLYSKIAGFLDKCQSPEGGFGGGPGQQPHLASTYAAVNALYILNRTDVINRKTLYRFLSSLRAEDGSFSMHVDGEMDIRGVYCAIAVAKLTNVYTPKLFERTEEWVAKCQTWEGGFGGCPGMEAHGGYAFCGLAALVLLNKADVCNVRSLLRWAANKQMRLEGGFQGRTNKLVDGCYSFWQGATFQLIHQILYDKHIAYNYKFWLFDQEALEEYLIICCQHPSGGLLDKPEKDRDIYHTCYALSGLSIAQYSGRTTNEITRVTSSKAAVRDIDPVYNLVRSTVEFQLAAVKQLPVRFDENTTDKDR